MTNQEIAEKIVALFAALNFHAGVYDSKQADDAWCVAGSGGVTPMAPVFDVKDGRVSMLSVHLLHGTLRATRRPARPLNWKAIQQRCEDIVALMRKDADLRARTAVAQAVVDDLKNLGLPAVVVSGRVSVTLDLSPEYAAEVGPKIAAIMSERKARTGPAAMCEHANETPIGVCSCASWCSCREKMCGALR
jgi:hypothetical protein